MKKIIKIMFACSLIALFLVQIGGASISSNTWWNSSWAYKKPIQVDSGYNFKNYQIKLNLSDEVNSTQGAVGIWRFLEGSGTKTADASGNHNDGTLKNGPVWTSEGLSFDGVDDYVKVPAMNVNLSSVTISLWAKSPTTTWNTWGWFASSRANNGFVVHPWKSDVEWCAIFYDSSGNKYNFGCHYPDNITVWHNYLITFNDSSNIGKGFFDGSEVFSDTISISRGYWNHYLYIGQDDYPGRHGHGTISDVRIYNRALSQNEINKTYCEGAYRLNKTSNYTYPSWCDNYLDTNIKKSHALYYKDIRFTDKNEKTELPYYQDLHHENVFYVKGNFTTSKGTQMYMYYGNPDATDKSNYYNTFHEGDNLVLDLPMKYQLGTNAWDVSGNGNNGTLYGGPTWVSNGLDFDGNNDYVRIPNSAIPPSSSDVSMSIWFKSDDASTFQYLYDGCTTNYNCYSGSIIIYIYNNYIYAGIRHHSGSGNLISTSFTDTTDFHHIIFTYNNSKSCLYLDNSKINCVSETQTRDTAGYKNFGARVTDVINEHHFNGIMFDNRIYNTSLSANEISLLYNERENPPTYTIGREQLKEPKAYYLKLTTDNTNYSLGDTVDLTIELNKASKSPNKAIFKLELIEPADNPDTILEKGPFTLPSKFYIKTTLAYTIPESLFVQSGKYGFKATLTDPISDTILASDETYFYINDTIILNYPKTLNFP